METIGFSLHINVIMVIVHYLRSSLILSRWFTTLRKPSGNSDTAIFAASERIWSDLGCLSVLICSAPFVSFVTVKSEKPSLTFWPPCHTSFLPPGCRIISVLSLRWNLNEADLLQLHTPFPIRHFLIHFFKCSFFESHINFTIRFIFLFVTFRFGQHFLCLFLLWDEKFFFHDIEKPSFAPLFLYSTKMASF